MVVKLLFEATTLAKPPLTLGTIDELNHFLSSTTELAKPPLTLAEPR